MIKIKNILLIGLVLPILNSCETDSKVRGADVSREDRLNAVWEEDGDTFNKRVISVIWQINIDREELILCEIQTGGICLLDTLELHVNEKTLEWKRNNDSDWIVYYYDFSFNDSVLILNNRYYEYKMIFNKTNSSIEQYLENNCHVFPKIAK